MRGVEVGARGAAVAGVDSEGFAQQFFDVGLVGAGAGQRQVLEGEVGGLHGAGERRDVVGLGGREAVGEVLGPEGVGG